MFVKPCIWHRLNYHKMNYLSVDRVSEILECSKAHVYALARSGRLTSKKNIGAPATIKLSSLVQFMMFNDILKPGHVATMYSGESGGRKYKYGFIERGSGGGDVIFYPVHCVFCTPSEGDKVFFTLKKKDEIETPDRLDKKRGMPTTAVFSAEYINSVGGK